MRIVNTFGEMIDPISRPFDAPLRRHRPLKELRLCRMRLDLSDALPVPSIFVSLGYYVAVLSALLALSFSTWERAYIGAASGAPHSRGSSNPMQRVASYSIVS